MAGMYIVYDVTHYMHAGQGPFSHLFESMVFTKIDEQALPIANDQPQRWVRTYTLYALLVS